MHEDIQMDRAEKKSCVAFLMSCQKLFGGRDRIYYWTFTWRKCQPDWYYPKDWNVLMRTLQTHYGGFLQGLRVLEVHPGKEGLSHGLHYHALVNQRMSVHVVGKLCERLGMGWPTVETKAVNFNTSFYLAKYLSKKTDLWPGMHRWGTIGGFRQCKVNNLEIDSAFHRNFRFFSMGMKLPITDVSMIYWQSQLWGDYSEWPEDQKEEIRRRVRNEEKRLLTSRGIPDNLMGNERKESTGSKSVTLCNAPF